MNEVASYLKNLQECCEFYQDNPEEEEGPSVDLEGLWAILVDLAQNNVTMLGKFYPHLEILADCDADFQEQNPPCVTNLIWKFCDPSFFHEERKKLLTPVVRLLPFFNKDNSIKVIQGMVEICDILMGKTHEIPGCVKRAIEEIIADSMQDSMIREIYATLQSNIETNKKAAATAVLACFADTLIERLDYANELLVDVQKGLDGNEMESLSACFLLSKIAPALEDEDDLNTDEILELLLPSIYDDNEEIRNFAFVAFKELCYHSIFLSESCSKIFINSFINFNSPDLIPFFFKCLRQFIKADEDVEENDFCIEEEDFDDEQEDESSLECSFEVDQIEQTMFDNVTPIRDYLMATLRSATQTDIISESIHTIADIISLSSSLIKDVFIELKSQIYSYIDQKNIDLYRSISYFIRYSLESSIILPSHQLFQRIMMIINCTMQQSSWPLEEKLKIIQNISSIARSVNKELIAPIFNIGMEFLNSNEEETTIVCSKILGNIARSLNPIQAKTSFNVVSSICIHIQDYHAFQILMKQLIQIISNKAVEADSVQPFIDMIMNSQVCALSKNGLSHTLPICKEAYNLIHASVKLGKAPKIGPSLINLVNDANKPSINRIISIATSAVEKGILTNQEIQVFTNFLILFFKKLSIEDEKSIIATADCFRAIYQQGNSFFDTKVVFGKITELIEDVLDYEEEEEEDDDESQNDNSFIMPLALLVFTVYLNDANLRVSRSLLKNLMDLLTITSDDEHTSSMISVIVKMYQHVSRFSCIQVASLQTFATLLSMDKETLSELDIIEEDIISMKQMIIDAVSYDQSFIPLITEEISDSQEKMRRFNTIFEK